MKIISVSVPIIATFCPFALQVGRTSLWSNDTADLGKGSIKHKPLLSGKDGSNHSRAIGDSIGPSQLAIIRTVNPIIAIIVNHQFYFKKNEFQLERQQQHTYT